MVDLPAPVAPTSATVSPGQHAQVDVIEREHGGIDVRGPRSIWTAV